MAVWQAAFHGRSLLAAAAYGPSAAGQALGLGGCRSVKVVDQLDTILGAISLLVQLLVAKIACPPRKELRVVDGPSPARRGGRPRHRARLGPAGLGGPSRRCVPAYPAGLVRR